MKKTLVVSVFRGTFLVAVALSLLGIAGCAQWLQLGEAQHSDRYLENGFTPAVGAKFAEANIPEDALGGIVMRLRDGKTLWARQAQRPMQPASTIKVLTSIVALETLKPAYRATTKLMTSGTITGYRLVGNLALVGGGADEFSVEQLQAMLRAIRVQGITHIEGDLILDREWFQPPRSDEGAAPFDESPEFRYNVIPDALMLGSNLLQLTLQSTDTEVRVAYGPLMSNVTVASSAALVDRACAAWEDGWKHPVVEKNEVGHILVLLQGEFPRQCNITTEVNLLNRTDYAERLVRQLWANMGGVWQGSAREGKVAVDARLLASQSSRSFAEIQRDINKRSDNPMARIALLNLGAMRDNASDTRSTFARGAQVVRDWLAMKQIDSTGLVLENGSGLSRQEMISPNTLAHVLRAAHASPWSAEFLTSLPIAGVDGAMRNRLSDVPMNERVRIKTGGLRNVTSVAGYLPDTSGDTLIVVFFLNHDNARGAKGRAVLDELMKMFMRY